MAAETLVEGCDPHNDPIDRRIMFEITGERLSDTDYSGESDEVEQEPRLLPGFSSEINEFDSAFGIFRPE